MAEQLERIAPGTLTADQVDLVRRTVARGATDDELAMFLTLAENYNLDPFAKEIVCGVALERDGSRKLDKHGQPYAPIIMVGRDGLLKIANSRGDYRGMISDVVHEKDEFRVRRTPEAPEGFPEHSYDQGDRGKVVGAYALVMRENRSATYFYAPWSEYGAPNARNADGKVNAWSPWAKYPSAMILKVAESVALKKAYSVSGVVSEEELDAGRAIEEGAEPAIRPRQPLRTPQLGPHGVVKREPREISPQGRATEPEQPPEETPEAPAPEPAPKPEKPSQGSGAATSDIDEQELERLRQIAEEG